jgi:hypothetical protein
MEMMASFKKRLHEGVLTAFPITLDVELLCISTLLRAKCELGKTKTGMSTLRKLCQQLTPHLAQLGQQPAGPRVAGGWVLQGAGRTPVEGQAGLMEREGWQFRVGWMAL